MTKRLKSKHKVDRRLKANIWGRPKSPFNSRAYPPGQHGQNKKESPRETALKMKEYYNENSIESSKCMFNIKEQQEVTTNKNRRGTRMTEIVPARAGSSGKHFSHVENCMEHNQQRRKKHTQERLPRKKTIYLAAEGTHSKITHKCFQHRPREINKTLQSSQRAPKSVPGAPRSPNRAPQAPKGRPSPLGSILGRFGPHN